MSVTERHVVTENYNELQIKSNHRVLQLSMIKCYVIYLANIDKSENGLRSERTHLSNLVPDIQSASFPLLLPQIAYA